jgi:hypothetical protein
MLFKVSGKFANNYTFSLNAVDATDAKDALASVHASDEIKNYGSPVVMTTVKALGGSKKGIRISDEPAKERKGGGRKKKVVVETPAPTPQPAASKRR